MLSNQWKLMGTILQFWLWKDFSVSWELLARRGGNEIPWPWAYFSCTVYTIMVNAIHHFAINVGWGHASILYLSICLITHHYPRPHILICITFHCLHSSWSVPTSSPLQFTALANALTLFVHHYIHCPSSII